MQINIAALNNNFVFKAFELNLNLKPRILSSHSQNSSSNAIEIQANEKVPLQRKEYEKLFNQKIDEKVKEAEAGMKTIYFRDPLTQKLTRSVLSNESLSKLGREFSSKELEARADGSYILSGKAENFVASWYADIAYARGYIKADKNKDGFLDDNELKQTRSAFMIQVLHNKDTNEISQDDVFLESYIRLNGKALGFDIKEDFAQTQAASQKEFGSKTIGLELDKMIAKDSNLDGKLTFAELGTENIAMNIKSIDDFMYKLIKMQYFLSNLNLENGIKGESISLNDEKTSDIWLKNALDKLGSGLDFKELSEEEVFFLKWHLQTELFDVKKDENGNIYLEYNAQKFKLFYEDFKEKFRQKSGEFLGLSKQEASKLNYETLGKVVDELNTTYLQAHSYSAFELVKGTINLAKDLGNLIDEKV